MRATGATDHVADHVAELADDLCRRIADEPDLPDFLLWRGGTIEHWIQILLSAVGNRDGRTAARGEVPYLRLGNPRPKYGDGAVLWPDGCALLVEMKAAATEARLSDFARAVAADLVALGSCDWSATLASDFGDAGTDRVWWKERDRISSVSGLSVAVLRAGQVSGWPEDAIDGAVTTRAARFGVAARRIRGRPAASDGLALEFRLVGIG